ncbi:MAG: hypothetical protein PHT00_00305 [Candidatus Methanomethylophilus sp.]|nr:hypothetical protein [Methanomethylophilus sp.]
MSDRDCEKEIEELRKEIESLKEMDEIILWRLKRAIESSVMIDDPARMDEYIEGKRDEERTSKPRIPDFMKPKSWEDSRE